MKKSLELKETRSDLVTKLEEVHTLASTEERELTSDESLNIDTMLGEIDNIDTSIERAEKVEKQLRQAAMVSGETVQKVKADKRYSIQDAINGYINNDLSGIEKEYHEEAKRHNTITGIGIPTFVFGSEKRNNPQLTSNASGMIATEVGDWAGTLQNKTVLGDLATWMYGLSGDMKLPTLSGTTAGWGTEVANATDAATVVGSSTLQPKKLSSYMDISKMLLAQTNGSVEGVIRDDMTSAIASVLEGAVLGDDAGAGATPQGVFDAGTQAMAGAAASYANILEMQKDLETANADFGRLAYITTPGGRQILKQVVGQPGVTAAETGYGQPLWAEDRIDGYMARSTQNTNNDGSGHPNGLVLGRWDDCVIGQFGNALDVVVDPYTKAISGEVRLVILSYWDVVYRRATSFQYTHIS